jgi:hypothetical protein
MKPVVRKPVVTGHPLEPQLRKRLTVHLVETQMKLGQSILAEMTVGQWKPKERRRMQKIRGLGERSEHHWH